MRFGENFMDELKSRVRPSDVVGRYVKLKRQGREFAGLSPFTNEKTPSFFVNDEKGFYHCFSSGKHGDAISFLMEVEGLSFPEAVERLAGLAGMDMPTLDPRAEERARENKKTISWMERAQEFFAKSLMRDMGTEARDYLKGRGLTRTAAEQFGIGYAPDSFKALRDELIQQGADDAKLIEAGLLIQPEDRNKDPWDRFRNRIMFPIHDARGRLIAFGGRALSQDQKAKYLNSPETPIFQKGQVLYNYPFARKALAAPNNPRNKIKRRGLIVCEGYMDVIAMVRAGFPEAVAPLGTALTDMQLDLLWRAGDAPILCFDGDKAGLRAAYRSVERALPLLKPGRTLWFALLPDGQDPDDLLQAKGPAAMQALLESARPLVDMVWQGELAKTQIKTPEDRAGLKERLIFAARAVQHDGVSKEYRTVLLRKFEDAYGWSAGRKGGFNKTPRRADPMLTQTMKPDAMQAARQRRLVGAIFEWPELLDHVDERFFSLSFTVDGLNALRDCVESVYISRKAVDKQSLHAHIENQGLSGPLRMVLRERVVLTASMGGKQADLAKRAALWMKEADTQEGRGQTDTAKMEGLNRMADALRSGNSEAMKRLMRADKASRE
jgi:DNA primase